MEQLSCTGRLFRPFVRLLSAYPGFDPKPSETRELPWDRRVDLQGAHEMVSDWVEATRDDDLGLKAGQLAELGSAGAVEYAMHSAATLGESISIARHYGPLISDAFEPTLVIEGDRASLRLGNSVRWPRSVADFMLSSWYRVHLRAHLAEDSNIECWFSYARPESVRVHEQVFEGTTFRFGAAYDGFVFDAACVGRPLASANRLLHTVHCEHLARLLSLRSEPMPVSMRVRQLIASELRGGRASAIQVAQHLEMSRRTLVRRLDAENTSFSAQLDDVRRNIALRLLGSEKLPVNQVAGLVGFAHVQAFHRAFKRWTGQTPMQYRKSSHAAPAVRAAE
jgi:AraC-like DNA-binding protein